MARDYTGWVNAALRAWADKANDLDDVHDALGKLIIGPRRVQVGAVDGATLLIVNGKVEARVRVEVLGASHEDENDDDPGRWLDQDDLA